MQEINKEYKSGEIIDCQRKEGSVRPRHSTSDENVAKVKQLVEELNNFISYWAMRKVKIWIEAQHIEF